MYCTMEKNNAVGGLKPHMKVHQDITVTPARGVWYCHICASVCNFLAGIENCTHAYCI